MQRAQEEGTWRIQESERGQVAMERELEGARVLVEARLESWAETEQAGPRRCSQVLPPLMNQGKPLMGLSRG